MPTVALEVLHGFQPHTELSFVSDAQVNKRSTFQFYPYFLHDYFLDLTFYIGVHRGLGVCNTFVRSLDLDGLEAKYADIYVNIGMDEIIVCSYCVF